MSLDLLRDASALEGYSRDVSGLRSVPAAVARPESAADAQELMRMAAAEGACVTAAGAQTSTTGASKLRARLRIRFPIYLLVTPIEFISTFLVRPFSLTVRLFANMLAGHILLVTFALLTDALFFAETMNPWLNIMSVLPFGMLLFLTAFEVLVAFLQAYIFTILAAVYIGGAAHPEH